MSIEFSVSSLQSRRLGPTAYCLLVCDYPSTFKYPFRSPRGAGVPSGPPATAAFPPAYGFLEGPRVEIVTTTFNPAPPVAGLLAACPSLLTQDSLLALLRNQISLPRQHLRCRVLRLRRYAQPQRHFPRLSHLSRRHLVVNAVAHPHAVHHLAKRVAGIVRVHGLAAGLGRHPRHMLGGLHPHRIGVH